MKKLLLLSIGLAVCYLILLFVPALLVESYAMDCGHKVTGTVFYSDDEKTFDMFMHFLKTKQFEKSDKLVVNRKIRGLNKEMEFCFEDTSAMDYKAVAFPEDRPNIKIYTSWPKGWDGRKN